jgi:2-oxo-4-hydroxy-4-carboxy-5-ureidoimidazoline decarboxylase
MFGVGQPSELSLDELNELPADAARRALARCCESERWVSAVLARRPYESLDSLLAQSDAAVAEMTQADLRAALDGHPRIGDRRAASAESAGWSGQEQAGVASAGAGLVQALAQGNAAYERRFGHIYLVCATGRSGAELLAYLHERLGNPPEYEWRVVAAELAKINKLRLGRLAGRRAAGTA